MLVDKKPIKIEVVVDPTKVQAAAATSGPKSLAQRATYVYLFPVLSCSLLDLT